MERESFESAEIGRLLNESFVSIKVDREERPDVDKVYMTFIQVIGRRRSTRVDIIIDESNEYSIFYYRTAR